MNKTKSLKHYDWLYFCEILKNIFHRHRIQPFIHLEKTVAHFTFTEELQQKWLNLFETKNKHTPFPYFMKETGSALSFFKVLDAYGFNLAHLLHVKSNLWFGKNIPLFELNQSYRTEYRLIDIVVVKEDRICLIYKGSIFKEDGTHIYDHKAAFLIKELKPHEVKLFDAPQYHRRNSPELFMNLSQNTSVLWNEKECSRYEITIPEKLGSHYGHVSGDMNFVHTSPLIAKLMGDKGAFIQGMCILSLLINKLTSIGYDSIEKLNFTFCHKVYEKQTIILLLHNEYYELVNPEGLLLVYGRVLRYDPDEL